MICLKYARPQDINLHFLGETRMCEKTQRIIIRLFQFVGFLMFKAVSGRVNSIGSFSVITAQKYGQTVVELFKYDEPVLTLITDCTEKWLVRFDGTLQDVADFVMEFTVDLLKGDGY